ncbi:uncharacterized protein LY89DRAFT_751925 [Mollisia scopiformis]|uniref:2EXR domain-containing protein n=1 Tax=Mollisia scopiformis TaxID=149040 RepID=A0A194X1V5_MOLSC|nr:uncharacterized protein LY89DRAFT_751925 [Mollisia scopiformis]KUJ14180.1 hypothetical protein LY89DRAFT_751925 [Mollisia scopiformis]
MSSLVLVPNPQTWILPRRPLNWRNQRSFPRFQSLPPELRLMVWELNLPGPRLVDVNYIPKTGEFYTTTASPVNLLVCRESRREAWKNWTLHFGTCGHPPLIRANLDIDTIQLDWFPIRLGLVDKLDVSRLRFLEIGGKDLQREHEYDPQSPALPESRTRIARQLLTFPKLEAITMVSPPLSRHFLPFDIARDRLPWQHAAQTMEFRRRRAMTYSHHLKLASALRKEKDTLIAQGRKVPILSLVLTEEDGTRFGPYIYP